MTENDTPGQRRSRKWEQRIFACVSIYAGLATFWFIVEEVRGYSATGIRLPAATYWRFAVTAGLCALFGAAYFASKKRERKEAIQRPVPTRGNGT
jgi:hypothetical protein